MIFRSQQLLLDSAFFDSLAAINRAFHLPAGAVYFDFCQREDLK